MRYLITIGLACIVASSCKTHSESKSDQSSVQACKGGIDIVPLLNPQLSCLKPGIWSSSAEEKKRFIASAIPCNKVTLIEQTADVFGDSSSDSEAAVRASTFFRIFNWLGQQDRFDLALQDDPFADLEGTASNDNPILETRAAQEVQSLIKQAKSTIFFDMFLIGGSWGVDIARELLRASRRGVQVVMLHDIESVFAVGNEVTPLWQRIKEVAAVEPNFVALDANVAAPARVSSIPFGLQTIGSQVAKIVDLTTSAEGRSDHSKILIIDGLYVNSPAELMQADPVPKALITSHNTVDSAASYYFDEGVIIEGPAAVASLVHFRSDLYWAWEQYKAKNSRSINADDSKLVNSFIERMDAMSKGSLMVRPRGLIGVEAVQVTANDEVRNLDSAILKKIVEAKQTIDLYGKIAYNWPLAIALKEAMARGVRVRIILDQQTKNNALLNSSLPFMIAKAPRRLPTGSTTDELIDENQQPIAEEDLKINWHLSFRPGYFFGTKDRTNLAQEIHAKTIIVDSRHTLFGSTNMDSFTWAGGFREYSVWVEDAAIAQQATLSFERLFQHPLLTIPHKVWLGKAPVPEPTQSFFDSLRQERAESLCPRKEMVCDGQRVLQGGIHYSKFAEMRRLIRNVTEIETKRIQQVYADQFKPALAGLVQCEGGL